MFLFLSCCFQNTLCIFGFNNLDVMCLLAFYLYLFCLEFSDLLGSVVYFLSIIWKTCGQYLLKYSFLPVSFPSGIPITYKLDCVILSHSSLMFVFFAPLLFFLFSSLCFNLDTFPGLIFKFAALFFCCVQSSSDPNLK